MRCPICNASDFYAGPSSLPVVCPDCGERVDAHSGLVVASQEPLRERGCQRDGPVTRLTTTLAIASVEGIQS